MGKLIYISNIRPWALPNEYKPQKRRKAQLRNEKLLEISYRMILNNQRKEG